MMKRIILITSALIMLATISPIKLQAAEIRTVLGKGYVGVYDTSAKRLSCKSETQGRTWSLSVAESVPSPADWSGVATSAGPVMVYTSGNATSYVLMRFQNGSTSSEGDGKSLRGPVAPGKLVVANWTPAEYGAKVSVVTMDGSKEYTTQLDINMWGTSKQISQKQRTIQPKREQVPNTGLSVEVPPGFTPKWDASSSCLGIVSDNGLPCGMMITVAEPGVDLPQFADLFMQQIGPALGSSDMKQVGSQNVSVGGKMPGLLRLANGSRNGKEATFAFVFFATPLAK